MTNDIDMVEYVSPEDDLMLALSNAGEGALALQIASNGKVELTVAHLHRAVEMGHKDFVDYAVQERRLLPNRKDLRRWVELGDIGSISILLHAGLPPEMLNFPTTSGQDARTMIREQAEGKYPETIALLDGRKTVPATDRKITVMRI